MLDIGGASRGHQPKENEDEELTQTEVAVGLRATGVPPSGQSAQQSHRDEPPTHGGRQDQAGHRGDTKGDERGDLDGAHRGQPARHQPDRPDPHFIGAAYPVGIVVDVVGPDLNEEGDDQRAERVAPVEVMHHRSYAR